MTKSHKGRLRVVAAATAFAVVTAVALAGCSSATGTGGSGDALSKETKAHLTYAIWDATTQPAYEKVAAEFTKLYPNIKVDVQVVPNADFMTKLKTQLPAGGGPDIFWMNGPNFQEFAAGGALAPLPTLNVSDYPKSLTDLYTYDGTVYGAPTSFDTVGLWYNKKLFDAAGVAYPTDSWKWADVQAAAAKLTNKDAGQFGIASAPYGQMTFYNTIGQAGGYVISPDHKTSGYGSDEAIEGVKFWSDFIKEGYSPSAQQMTDTYPGDLFTSGKLAMWYDGSWSAKPFAASPVGKDINVVHLPGGPANNQTVVHGGANVVNAKSKNVAAAQAFAVFATQKAAAEIMASTGTTIPAFNGTQGGWVDAYPQYNVKIFVDEALTGFPYPISKMTSVWNKYEADSITKIWSGEATPEQELPELAKQMQAALDAE